MASYSDLVEVYQFVFDSPLVEGVAGLARLCLAELSRPGGRSSPRRSICASASTTISSTIPKATTVSTPLPVVLELRRGVCQDFAHLAIGCLRSLGLAARYVSGYLLTQPPEGKPRLVGSDASHAWLSVYTGNSGWLDIDPTNNVVPSLEHITLAWGRDYSDVCPIQGRVHRRRPARPERQRRRLADALELAGPPKRPGPAGRPDGPRPPAARPVTIEGREPPGTRHIRPTRCHCRSSLADTPASNRMSDTELIHRRTPAEPLPDNLRSVQPGGGVCYQIELAWGRWRRWYLKRFAAALRRADGRAAAGRRRRGPARDSRLPRPEILPQSMHLPIGSRSTTRSAGASGFRLPAGAWPKCS